MAPRQQALQKLLLILTVLPCCTCLTVSIPQREYEIARGSDITLTCSFVPARPGLSMVVLTWEASPHKDGDPLNTVASVYANGVVDIAPAYEGRVTQQFDADQRKSTLTLTKVTLQDSRSYQCSVLIPNDDEGTTAATTSLLVLVAPSTPICAIRGTAEYYQDITLTCESEEGSPPPTYDWKSYSVESVPRPFPPKTVKEEGALSLFNISRETSGFFTCTSTNRIGSASCNITLAVMPPSSNTGTIIGIVVGVIAGLVLIVILICFFRKRSKKKAAKERSAGQMEFYDKDSPEGGEQYRDQESSGNKKKAKKHKGKGKDPKKNRAGGESESDDSDSSDKEKRDGKDNAQVYKDTQQDQSRGSQDHLDDQRDRYRGSRERLDDQRDQYRGSRERLDDQRDQYRGSREHLDVQRNQYRGSRERLDDQRDQYRGSRERLDDQRNQYRGSRERLDDQRNQYRSSRDRLDDQRDQYRGSRERLDDGYDRYDRDRDTHNDHYHISREDHGDRGGHYSSGYGRSDDYD